MSDYTLMRSDLAKARNLGSAGHGTHHWWHQRLTAIALVPLVVWLTYFIYSVSGMDAQSITQSLRMPYNLIPAMLLLMTGLYHGMLGMQVVIEDYVSNLKSRYFLIIAVKVFSIITILAGFVALISLIK